MALSPSLKSLSSRSSSVVSINRKLEPLLPRSIVPEKGAKIRVRTLLGHCHYRRVFLWTLTLTFIVILALVKSKNGGKGYDIGGYHFGGTKAAPAVKNITNTQTTTKVYYDAGTPIVFMTGDLNGDGQEEYITEENLTEEQQKHLATVQRQFTPWIRFPHLNGYFNGIKTIVNKAHLVPEYPNITEKAPLPPPINEHDVPKPAPYSPYKSSDDINTCYLDVNETIPAPDIYAYNGVPQDMPDPALGSYELLGMRDDVCFDRFSRYGPYGLGYSKIRGGSGSGIDTESEGSEEVWAKSGKIDYSNMDWGDAQERCFKANEHRFQQVDDDTGELQNVEGKKGRTAVVIRSYTGFRWTEHAILNFRALINELSLRSGGEYHVHFLVQVRDVTAPIFSDDQTAQRIIDENVPAEFRSLVTLWSEPQMKLFYPGAFPDPVFNPSGQDIHGIYRSAHFPLQVFALHHPEYEHFWNWEMDMRYLGSYYEFFDRIGKWSAEQPRPFMWERSARYYIPSYHGTWENFTKTVQKDTLNSGRSTVFGPVDFEGKGQLLYEFEGKSVMPASCSSSADNSKCGVGEDADLITLNPLFDTEDSGWFFTNDVTGYAASTPRRCAIITAGRLSRRLLMAMHEEVWRHHHTMFSEMFPPSVALHHGFKALYAPHPIYLERAWYPYSDIDSAFNGGRDHSTSGQGSPFDLRNEHNHKGTSWYYHSEWAGMLWRRWLGYAQRDGRGGNGGRLNTGEEKGGKLQEMDEKSTGRMCLRGMLVHPIKYEHPSESAAQPY